MTVLLSAAIAVRTMLALMRRTIKSNMSSGVGDEVSPLRVCTGRLSLFLSHRASGLCRTGQATHAGSKRLELALGLEFGANAGTAGGRRIPSTEMSPFRILTTSPPRSVLAVFPRVWVGWIRWMLDMIPPTPNGREPGVVLRIVMISI